MLHPDSKIMWEDFSENYGENSDRYNDIEDDFRDDDDEDDDEMGDPDQNRGITAVFSNLPGFMGGPRQVISTPWGQFSGEDKFAPTEFYKLKVLHFYKFNVNTLPNFMEIMDSIDGVAIWKCQDPYCVIIGKAKAYEWDEVVYNVEMAILGKKQVNKSAEENPHLKIAEDAIKLKEELGIPKYIVAVFPNGKCVDKDLSSETPEEYTRICKEVLDLADKLPGIIIVQDGEILCK